MSYHISEQELQTALGVNATDGLADSDADTIDLLIEMGSALVDSATLNAGYTPPKTTKADPTAAPKLIKMATIGAVSNMLWGRKGLTMPEGLNIFGSTFNALVTGELKIPGMDPSTLGGVGGNAFSSSDEGHRPPVFTGGSSGNGGLRKVY